MKQRWIDQAQEHWDAERPLETGRLLCRHIPLELRPVWAAEILAIAYSHIPTIPEIETILEIAHDRSRWPEAREAFSAMRKLTLQVEDPLYEGVFFMAENFCPADIAGFVVGVGRVKFN